MSQNITIMGASYSDVPAVTLPKTGGGTATFTDVTDTTAAAADVARGKLFYDASGILTTGTSSGGGSSTPWLPPSAELVASVDEYINLSTDTTWDSWTPSTSQTTIMSAGTARGACSYTIDADHIDKAAILAANYRVDYGYSVDAAKGYELYGGRYYVSMYAPMRVRSSNPASVYDYYSVWGGSSYVSSVCSYMSSATTITTTGNLSYGIVGSLTVGISSANTVPRSIGFTRNALTARCNSTYFSTAAANNLDTENTVVVFNYRIWLVDRDESILYALFNGTDGIFNGN